MKSDQPIRVPIGTFRQIVDECIASSIETHRDFKSELGSDYERPVGPPTEEEIDDFILSNPLYDSLTATNITDPALDGFAEGHTAEVGLAEFRKHTRDYAETGAWLLANLVYHHLD